MRFKRTTIFSIVVAVVITILFVALRNRPDEVIITEPEEIPSKYSESPMLTERVERGELPPVEERLPDNPLVVKPLEEIGRYDSDVETKEE